MTNRAWLARTGASVVVLTALGLVWAQPPAGPETRYLSDQRVGATCLDCHREPGPGAIDQGSDKFILLRESVYWRQHDLHRRAFDALTSPLGRQMSRLLYRGDETAAARTPACLACHATDTAPETPLDKADAAARFNCQLGVNCQACHGPGKDWLGPHSDAAEWRMKLPTEKAKLGLTNLRDPVVRAGTCAGCHVGSAAGSKFVTHAMYAAGHPPLPPFELATFSRDEPRHWRPAAAVEAITKLPPDDARKRFCYREGEIEAARLVAVGAVIGLRESVDLLNFESADPLDFAHFNCAACHHELRPQSDRQQNGFPGAPGRPVPQTWPIWTVRAVLRNLKGPDAEKLRTDFDEKYEALRRAFDATPFGDKAEVRNVAAELVKICNALLGLIDRTETKYDKAAAWELMAALAVEAAARPDKPTVRRDYFDLDGAAQLARAAAVIYEELAVPPVPGAAPPREPPSFDPVQPDPKKLADPLRQLNALVGLGLRDVYQNGIGPDGKPPPGAAGLIQSGPLAVRSRRADTYSSVTAREQFAELVKRLTAKP